MLFITLILAFCLIKIFSCALPLNVVNNNIRNSWTEFQRAGLYPVEPLVSSTEDWERDSYGQIDFFTELIMINFANTVTGDYPLTDAMRNPYSSVKNANEYNPLANLEASITKNQDIIEAPQYWWGLAAIYRILFSIFTYDQILIIYKLIFYLILFWCFKKISDNLDGTVGMIFVGSLLIGNFPLVTYSPNLGITFIISFVGIIVFFFKRKNPRSINSIMIIMGACTAYFDWMSTPIITYQMPVCIALIYMAKNGILTKIRNYITVLIKTTVIWALSYGGALGIKWILSALVLKKNIFVIVESRIGEGLSNDVTGKFGSNLEYIAETVKKNMSNLLTNKLGIHGSQYLITLMLIMVCVLIFISYYRKNELRIEFTNLASALGLLSLAPITWYAVFKGHTYIHFWFTYRSLIGTVMCLLLSMFSLYMEFKRWLCTKKQENIS